MNASTETQNELKVRQIPDHSCIITKVIPDGRVAAPTMGVAGLAKTVLHESDQPDKLSSIDNRRFGSDAVRIIHNSDTLHTMYLHDGHGPQGDLASSNCLIDFPARYGDVIQHIILGVDT